MALLIIAMIAFWCVVVLSRHAVWAHWCGYKLRRSAGVEDRLSYVARLASLGEASESVAAGLLGEDEIELRSYGVLLLSKLDTPGATRQLQAAIDQEDAALRASALQAFGRRRGEAVRTHLVGRLADERHDVAMQAAFLLGAYHSDQAVPTLIRAARQHNHPGVRIQAIQALAMVDADEAIDALIECLGDQTTFAGRTPLEEAAHVALASMVSEGSVDGDAVAPPDAPSRRTIEAEAVKALRVLTGETFGYEPDHPAAREAAIAAWKRWRAENP
jgi:HEAT repeat protein